jgi:hypothetical protein
MSSDNEKVQPQSERSSATRRAAVEILIQEAITEVAQADLGEDRPRLMAALDGALASRGIGEQPRPWVEAVAETIVRGTPYVESERATAYVRWETEPEQA